MRAPRGPSTIQDFSHRRGEVVLGLQRYPSSHAEPELAVNLDNPAVVTNALASAAREPPGKPCQRSAAVIDAWPTLPAVVKADITAITAPSRQRPTGGSSVRCGFRRRGKGVRSVSLLTSFRGFDWRDEFFGIGCQRRSIGRHGGGLVRAKEGFLTSVMCELD